MCKNYEQCGLKSVSIFSKKSPMLYDTETDLFNRCLEKNFNFHSNLLEKSSLIQNFPFFYQEMVYSWHKHLSSTIMPQFLWFSKCILLEKQSFLFPTLSNNALNDIGHIFNNNRETKDWETIKLEFNSENRFHFSWKQLIDSILEKKYYG